MKNFFLLLVVFIFSSTLVLGASGEALENTIISGDAEDFLVYEENEVIDISNGENIMLVGDVVNADGAAEDLIILAGESVNSYANGEYGFMAANNLNISGDVLKDNFVAGNNINVIGDIGRDAYLFGSIININGTIGRNLYVYGSEINISGTINGDAKVSADKIFISSEATISGDIEINAEYIEIEEGTQIGGVVTYNSNAKEIIIPNSVRNNKNDIVDIQIEEENILVSEIKDIAKWICINIVLFIITILICPAFFDKIDKIFKEKDTMIIGNSIGWGLLLFITTPIISIIALITVIGSALGFAALLIYIVILVYSTVITGYLLGRILFDNKNLNKYLIGVIGIVIIEILRRLPVIGGIMSFIVLLVSIGVIREFIRKDEMISEQINE